MTKETVSSITKKIHWFVIPLLISLLTWIVVMIYTTKESTSVITTELKSQKEMSEKIYNNLEHKLGVDVYEIRHTEVIKDIDELKVKVDKIGRHMNLTFDAHNYKSQLVHTKMLMKEDMMLVKIDSIQYTLNNRIPTGFIYKNEITEVPVGIDKEVWE